MRCSEYPSAARSWGRPFCKSLFIKVPWMSPGDRRPQGDVEEENWDLELKVKVDQKSSVTVRKNVVVDNKSVVWCAYILLCQAVHQEPEDLSFRHKRWKSLKWSVSTGRISTPLSFQSTTFAFQDLFELIQKWLVFWFCQSKRLFMTPLPHTACRKQIALAGKRPATESLIICEVFTDTEMTSAIPNKYLLKVKQKYVTLPHPAST